MKEEIDQIRDEIHKHIVKDPAKANLYIDQLKHFLDKANSEKLESEYYYYKGLYFQSISNFQNAVDYFNQAIKVGSELNYNELLQKSFNSLGACYRIQQDYKRAIEMYSNAVNGPDKSAKSATYNNIAIIYNDLKEFDLALEYYERAATSFIETEQWQYVVIVQNNIAKLLLQMNNLDRVYSVLTDARLIIEKIGSSPLVNLVTIINFSRLYIHDNKYLDALVELEKAKEIAIQHQLTQNITLVYTLLGETHEKLKNYSNAIEYYKRALSESKELSIYSQIEIHEKILQFYALVSDYQRAFEEAKILMNLKENLYKKEKNQEINKLVIQFETKEKESEIEKLNIEKELNKVVVEKGVELQKANQRLTEYNDELLQFSYAISHDFREPVRMVSTFTQLLQKSLKESLNFKDEELMGYIILNTIRMERLISDLYKYSKADNIELKIEKFYFTELIDEILELRGISKQIVKIKNLAEMYMIHYKSPISQILQNIISNSIKYQRKDIELTIDVLLIESKNSYEISIKDNGIGIEKEHHKMIFQLFKRVPSSEENEGTGLGLALCQKLCRKLGGEIAVISEGVNKGTEIFVTLPKVP